MTQGEGARVEDAGDKGSFANSSLSWAISIRHAERWRSNGLQQIPGERPMTGLHRG